MGSFYFGVGIWATLIFVIGMTLLFVVHVIMEAWKAVFGRKE